MAWAPTGVPGLLISLDGWSLAEDFPGIAHGDALDTWPDGSGVAGNAVTATPGEPANVTYDGSDTRRPGVALAVSVDSRLLLPVNLFDGLDAATGGEVFIIAKAGHGTSTRFGFWFLWDSDYVTQYPYDGRIYDAAFSTQRGFNFIPAAIDDAPHVLNEYGQTGSKGIRWDGAVVASSATNTFAVNKYPVRPWLGASESYGTGTQRWQGTIYAFLAFDHVLTTAERDSVYQQLADRHALTVTLSDGTSYVGNPDPPAPPGPDTLAIEISIVDDRDGPIVTHAAPAGAATMQFEILEGFYDPSRALFVSEWLPVASPIVLAAGTFAPGWRNLFRVRYRDASDVDLGDSQIEEFFPAWAHPPADPLPSRNTKADFEIEGVAFEGTSSTRRPDALSWTYRLAHTVGPRDFSDPSAGFVDRVWRIRYDVATGDVYVRRANDAGDAWEPETLLFTAAVEISEIDLAFDQNGRPIACAEVPGALGPEVWLYWPSPSAGGALVFEKIADGRNPRLLLDDPVEIAVSDVLLFYFSDAADHLCYRSQSELFGVENLHPLTRVTNYFLEDVALAQNFRLQIIGSVRDPATGNYALAVTESAPYPFRPVGSADTRDEIIDAEVVDVLYVFEFVKEVDSEDRIGPLPLEELVAIEEVDPVGVDHSGDTLLTAELFDTTLKYAIEPVGVDHAGDSILTVTQATYVIDTTDSIVEADSSDRITSITLVPA